MIEPRTNDSRYRKNGDLSIAYRPPILQLLKGTMAKSFNGEVVGVGYLAPEGWSLLTAAIDRVNRVQ